MADTLVTRLLDAADSLLKEGSRSAAFKRRAVSTAYYAVFHSLAKTCADSLSSMNRSATEYERVYRALDHGPLKARFDSDQLLRTHANIREIGNLVVILQSARQRADYLPPIRNVFSPDQVRELVNQARLAVDKIEALEPGERQTLAIALLFKDRQQ